MLYCLKTTEKILEWQNSPLTTITYQPNGDIFAFGTADGFVEVWDTNTSKKLCLFCYFCFSYKVRLEKLATNISQSGSAFKNCV